MSAELEHRECADALGAYALGALSAAEVERVRRHLADCPECRAQLEWLRPAVDALPASVEPVEPPPELKARVMALVEAEAELLRAAGQEADSVPEATRPRRRRGRWPQIHIPRLALGLAAAGLIAVAVVAGVLTAGGGTGTRTLSAQIANPALAGQVQASLRVQGTSAELSVSGLPAPAANHVDQLWVKHNDAPPAPAGTFIVQSGTVHLARPVHPGDRVLVTVEPGRGSRAPTTKPFVVVNV